MFHSSTQTPGLSLTPWRLKAQSPKGLGTKAASKSRNAYRTPTVKWSRQKPAEFDVRDVRTCYLAGYKVERLQFAGYGVVDPIEVDAGDERPKRLGVKRTAARVREKRQIKGDFRRRSRDRTA